MSRLLLVRHAQASFFEEDYDRLSPLGETQSRLLGEHWLSVGFTPDEVYTGPRRRHQRTAEIVGECFRSADQAWPNATVVTEWDEHEVDQLVTRHRDVLLEADSGIRDVAELQDETTDPAEYARCFQLLFEAAARLWVRGQFAASGIVTWPEFQQRVERSLDAITRQAGRGRRVVVFTSVGPITVALQRAMQCDVEPALATGWRLRNCSQSSFAFSGSRFTLDVYNGLAHLRDHQDWTYR